MGTRSKESQESCKRLSVCCEVSQMGDIFTAGKSSEQKQVKRERKNIKATEAELEELCVRDTRMSDVAARKSRKFRERHE